MKSRKKTQRKWESTYHRIPEEYNSLSKKEKEFLSKYKNIAGDYLEDWECIELFKKNNFDEEQISKELNKIVLGDEFKWKEIKNGKAVTTRSTDQIRKKQRYYKSEKNYNNTYEKNEDDSNSNKSYNKRKKKGSYHKNINDFYHYVSKKPKRPFQKCIEVPSDYLPLKNNINSNNNISENKNIINTDNNINNNNDINNNNNNIKITPSKSANNINNKINELQNKKALSINMNKIEETKNDENEKITSEEEEQRKIILIKGEVFKNLKKLKTNTEIKLKENKNRPKEIYKTKETSEQRLKTSGAINTDYNLLNQDIKNDKALQKKYLKIFFGNMNHYSKKVENNIKRATSKDSETSDDRPDTIKRIKRNNMNNIPTNSNIIQKKSRAVNINSNNKNININKNLRRVYDIDQREREIEFESKVVNLTINSCYDNPYRDQYLKFINEKRKKNPGKIVELIIPQFNNMFMPPYPFPYQYPYLNQNMMMYPSPQYQASIPISNHNINLNSQNKQNNMQQIPQYQNYIMNPPLMKENNIQLNKIQMMQMNIPNINQKQMNLSINNNNNINSNINLHMSPQVNYNGNYLGINNPELLSPKSNKEINSDNQINNMSDN